MSNPVQIGELIKQHDDSLKDITGGLKAGDHSKVVGGVAGVIIGLASGLPELGAILTPLIEKGAHLALSESATKRLEAEWERQQGEDAKTILVTQIAESVEMLLGQVLVQLTCTHHRINDTVHEQLGGLRADLKDFRDQFQSQLDAADIRMDERDVLLAAEAVSVSAAARRYGWGRRSSRHSVELMVEHTAPKPLQLPTAPVVGMLLGRSAERQRLVERLARGQDTAILGSAGFGKTALAAEALRDVLRVDGELNLAKSNFPDGVVLVDLHSAQPHAVYKALVDAFGQPGLHAATPTRESAREACRNKRALIILEGAEQADGQDGRIACADLLTVLDGANTRLILTRDREQALPAQRIELNEVLCESDAEELLRRAAARPLAEAVAKRVLALMQGHPLALTWAGGHLGRGGDDPARLVDAWSADGFADLSDPRPGGHDYTLQRLYERSLRSLPASARLLLNSAALLAHTAFPMAALQTLFADPSFSDDAGSQLSSHIQRLDDARMLRRAEEPHYYQFDHVLAYHFVRRQGLHNSLALERLAAWLQDTLVRALELTGAWDGQLIDRSFLHLDALLRADRDRVLWPLAKYVVYDASTACIERGRLAAARLALQSVEHWFRVAHDDAAGSDSDAQAHTNIGEHVEVLHRLGRLQHEQGDLRAAQSCFEQAQSLSRQLLLRHPGPLAEQALLHNLDELGRVLHEQGDTSAAIAGFERSLALVADIAADDDCTKWREQRASLSRRLAEARQAQGELDAAVACFEQASTLLQELAQSEPDNARWPRELSAVFEQIGDLQRLRSDRAGALRSFEHARKLAKLLADVNTRRGEMDAALQSLAHIANLSEKLVAADSGSALRLVQLADALESLATAQQRVDLSAAQLSLEQSCEQRRALHNIDPENMQWQRELGSTLAQLGQVQQLRGDLAGAQRSYEESSEIARSHVAIASDAASKRTLSLRLDRLAELQCRHDDLASAASSYEESLQLAKALVEQEAQNPTWQYELALSHRNLGRVRLQQSSLSAAREHYKEGCDILRRLAPTKREPRAGGALSQMLSTLGELQLALADVDGAQQSFQAMHAIDSGLAAKGGVRQQLQLTEGLAQLARVARAQGDLGSARAQLEHVCTLNQALVDAADHVDNLAALSNNLLELGKLCSAMNDIAAARKHVEQCCKLREQLLARHPNKRYWQRQLVDSLDRLAHLQGLQGQTVEVEATYARCCPLWLEVQRPDADDQIALSDRLQQLGRLQQGRVDLASALRTFEQQHALNNVILSRDSTEPLYRRLLSMSWNDLGRVHKARGDLDAAVKAFEHSAAIRASLLADAAPEHVQSKLDLISSLTLLGGVQRERGDMKGAQQGCQRRCEIHANLVEADPSIQNKQDWASCLDELGDIQRTRGQSSAALRSFEQGRDIRAALAEPNDDPAHQRDLSISLNQIGRVYREQGELLLAQRSFEQGFALRLQLAEARPSDRNRMHELFSSYEQLRDVQLERGDERAAERNRELVQAVLEQHRALTNAKQNA